MKFLFIYRYDDTDDFFVLTEEKERFFALLALFLFKYNMVFCSVVFPIVYFQWHCCDMFQVSVYHGQVHSFPCNIMLRFSYT